MYRCSSKEGFLKLFIGWCIRDSRHRLPMDFCIFTSSSASMNRTPFYSEREYNLGFQVAYTQVSPSKTASNWWREKNYRNRLASLLWWNLHHDHHLIFLFLRVYFQSWDLNELYCGYSSRIMPLRPQSRVLSAHFDQLWYVESVLCIISKYKSSYPVESLSI